MNYDQILEYSPFLIPMQEKNKIMLKRLAQLTQYHQSACLPYREILDKLYSNNQIESLEDVPFLPVQLFKRLELCSVLKEDVFKTMTSSGTTGQQVSKIFLDKTTANNQQKTLVKIVTDFTGASRMPMIILDCPSVVKDRKMFSARGAGILGFSIFGSKRMYALNDDMTLNVEELRAFVDKYRGQTIFLFGFTFMIWQYVYKELLQLTNPIDLSKAVLIHGGGWKKLQNQAVSKEEFKKSLHNACGISISNIHDYYGMVEQTGCIYMECECGHLHASTYSDVLIRNMKDFSLCKQGEEGVIQVLSMLPESYPGHSILTEDVGRILGEDDCPCGRKGKYFEVLGRMKHAEIRGCSDTFER